MFKVVLFFLCGVVIWKRKELITWVALFCEYVLFENWCVCMLTDVFVCFWENLGSSAVV